MPKVIPEHLRISPQPFRQWCEWRLDPKGWDRPGSAPVEDDAVRRLAFDLGIGERKLLRWRKEFPWLDRLEVEDALRHAGFELWDVYPNVEEMRPRRGEGPPPGYGSRFTDDEVLDLHRLHERGVPIKVLAERVYAKAGYSSWETAAGGIRRGFRRLGLPTRGFQRFSRHISSSRRCTAENREGDRCKQAALTDSDRCVRHDPRTAEAVQEAMLRGAAEYQDRTRRELAA